MGMQVSLRVLEVLGKLRDRYGEQPLRPGETEIGLKQHWNFNLGGFHEDDLRGACRAWMADNERWPLAAELVRLAAAQEKWRRCGGRQADEPKDIADGRVAFNAWWGETLGKYPWLGDGIFVTRLDAELMLAKAVESYGSKKRFASACVEAWLAGDLRERFASAMRGEVAKRMVLKRRSEVLA